MCERVVCDKVVRVKEGRGADGGREADGIQNKKRTPHKDVGNKQTGMIIFSKSRLETHQR